MSTETVITFVRPGVVVMLVGGLTWGWVEGRVSMEVYVPFATAAMAWLFAERTSQKAHEAGVQAALTIPPALQPPNPPTGGNP